MSFKRKAQQTAFELAFVVTRDNAILDKLQFLGFIADLAQTYAYVYDPKIDWGFREGQKTVGYLIAHLDHLGPAVVNALWAALLTGGLVLLISTLHSVWQMFRGGAVTSLAALHAMRILASLYATVLLFPTLNSLVLPLVARSGLAFYFSPTSIVAADPIVAISAAFLPMFLLNVLSVYFFLWDPDPTCRSLLGRATPSGDVKNLVFKLATVLAFQCGSGLVGAIVLLIYTAQHAMHDMSHPSYYSDAANLWRAFVGGSHFVAAIFAVAVAAQSTPPEDATMAIVCLGVSLGCGLLAAVRMARKFHYLDPVAFTKAQNRAKLGTVPSGKVAPESGSYTLGSVGSTRHLLDTIAGANGSGEYNGGQADDDLFLFTQHALHEQVFNPAFFERVASPSDLDIVLRRVLRYKRPFQLSTPISQWFTVDARRDARLTGEDGEKEDAAAARASRGLKEDIDAVGPARMATGILEAALGVFPKSSLLWIRYATVLTLGFNTADRKTARRAVSLASTLKPFPLELRYAAFFLSKFLQKTAFILETGQELDVLQVMRFQHDLRRAKFHQQQAQRIGARLWRTVKTHNVGSGSGDRSAYAWSLSSYAKEVERHDAQASLYYSRLLENFPNSKTVLRLFASFMGTVKNEAGASRAILDFVDSLEEEDSRRNASAHLSRSKIGLRPGHASTVSALRTLASPRTKPVKTSSSTNTATQALSPTNGAATPSALKGRNSKSARRASALAVTLATGVYTAPASTPQPGPVVPALAIGSVGRAGPPSVVVSEEATPAVQAQHPVPLHFSHNKQGSKDDSEAVSMDDAGSVDAARSEDGVGEEEQEEESSSPSKRMMGDSDEGRALRSARKSRRTSRGGDDSRSESSGGGLSDMLSGDDGGDGNGPIAQVTEMLRMKARERSSAVVVHMTATFTRSMSLTLAFLLACICSLYILGVLLLSDTAKGAQLVGDVGGLRRGTQDLLFRVRQLEMATAGVGVTWTVSQAQAAQTALATAANTLQQAASALIGDLHTLLLSSNVLRYTYQELEEFWDAETDMNYYNDFSRTKGAVGMPYWDAIKTYTGAAIQLASVANTTYVTNSSAAVRATASEALRNSINWRMVMDNGVTAVFRGMWNLVNGYQDRYRKSTDTKQTVLIAVTASVVLLPLVLTVALFLPSYMRIRSDRKRVTGLFDLVPEAAITEVLCRIDETYAKAHASATGGADAALVAGDAAEMAAIAQMKAIQGGRSSITGGSSTPGGGALTVGKRAPLSARSPNGKMTPRRTSVSFLPNDAQVPDKQLEAASKASSAQAGNVGSDSDSTGSTQSTDPRPSQNTMTALPPVASGGNSTMINEHGSADGLRSGAESPVLETSALGKSVLSTYGMREASATAAPPVPPSVHAAGAASALAHMQTPQNDAVRNSARGVSFRDDPHESATPVQAAAPSTGKNLGFSFGLAVKTAPTTPSLGPAPAWNSMSSPTDPAQRYSRVTVPTSDGATTAELMATTPTARQPDAFDDDDAGAAPGALKSSHHGLVSATGVAPASSITDRSKENQQLRAVVLPYLTSVSILLAMSLAIAGILLETNVKFGARALEINYAGSRRSGTYRLMVLAQELIRNDSTTWPDTSVLRAQLLQEADDNYANHESVLHGNPTLGLPGMLGRDAYMDSLMLSPLCPQATIGCMPIDQQFRIYVDNVRRVATAPDANLSLTMPAFATLRTMQSGSFSTTLNTAKDALTAASGPILAEARAALDALFGISFLLGVVAALLLRRAVREVQDGIARTRYVLLMLPPQTIRAIPPIEVYLREGKLQDELRK